MASAFAPMAARSTSPHNPWFLAPSAPTPSTLFFQLLHQGSTTIPVDFLIPASMPEEFNFGTVDRLIANAFAQADALAFGRDEDATRLLLESEYLDHETVERLVPHRSCPGDRPSSILMYRDLTPEMLGKIIAIYEHKTVITGYMWGVNSFDQWGVELGKTMAERIAPMVTRERSASPSLAHLIDTIHDMRGHKK